MVQNTISPSVLFRSIGNFWMFKINYIRGTKFIVEIYCLSFLGTLYPGVSMRVFFRVLLYFQFYNHEQEIRAAKTAAELVAEIGGHLGLFVGVSFLTAVEVVELACNICFGNQRRKIYSLEVV